MSELPNQNNSNNNNNNNNNDDNNNIFYLFNSYSNHFIDIVLRNS